MRRITTFRTAAHQVQIRQAERQYEAERLAETQTRRLYKTAAWQRLRIDQLTRQPLCILCIEADPDAVEPATVCDHVEPHRGDVERFWAGPFQSLCATCHSGLKQREEQGAR
jgi:5-methylcytosine-specific restriction enzyme A